VLDLLFPMSPEMRQRQKEADAAHAEARLLKAVPWTDDIKWSRWMTIQADTYKVQSLFPELKAIHNPDVIADDVRKKWPTRVIVTPDEHWMVCNKRLPRGERLWITQGNTLRNQGDIMFDGDIVIPVLYYRSYNYAPVYEHFRPQPMMSLAPMEIMTLRCGTKHARGHVVIGGLGLAHQLIEVSKRKQVTSITVIEQSQELVDLIMPRAEKLLANGHKPKIICGDVNKELPKVRADVALIDTTPSFGFDQDYRDKLKKECPKIDKIWVWGGGAAR
jgi:hypothetical protein